MVWLQRRTHICGCVDLLVKARFLWWESFMWHKFTKSYASSLEAQVDDFENYESKFGAFKAIARPIFGYFTRHFNIKTLAIFWSLLHLMVAVILTINTSIPIFILAAFLNGCTMGGSIGTRMVLIIELLGEKLLVRNSISSNSGHLGYLRVSWLWNF